MKRTTLLFALTLCPAQAARAADTNSPFGFHSAVVIKPGYTNIGHVDAQNIGVRWDRGGLYASWFIIQTNLSQPVYDFGALDQQWRPVPAGISILANIDPQGIIDEGRCLPGSWMPVDEAKYTDFVKATIERYDGDGTSDMPGLTNPVKYWQVGNEPDNRARTNFAGLQRITYQAIKQACPSCIVLIGGVPGFPSNYVASFDAGYAPILAGLGASMWTSSTSTGTAPPPASIASPTRPPAKTP
jgi:hypothetical protein